MTVYAQMTVNRHLSHFRLWFAATQPASGVGGSVVIGVVLFGGRNHTGKLRL
jgi:hypothetical protein